MAEIDSVVSRGTNSTTRESTPLLSKGTSTRSKLLLRYRSTRKCVSSRAAVVVLLWSFVIGLMSGLLLNSDLLWDFLGQYETYVFGAYFLYAYGGIALIYCFFPIAGYLADIKCGRFNAIITSVIVVLVSAIFLIMVGVAAMPFIDEGDDFPKALYVVLVLVIIPLDVGLIGFTANVVQFGMDQLHDSPGEDRTLFIHWYVWLWYLSLAIGQSLVGVAIAYYMFEYSAYHTSMSMLFILTFSVIVVLITTLCLVRYKRHWFLIEPGRTNPYRLVYRVTKFACQHKTPVRRSAFTYCEDELPMGLDLGKEKYGGCFTTEEVEDVKAFYGILKVLFSFGIVFFLDFAANSILPLYAHYHTTFTDMEVPLKSGVFSSLLVVVSIPLYLFLLRPFLARYVPGMLKRMGLGMLLVVLSLISSFAMDTSAHLEETQRHPFCMFNNTATEHPQDAKLLLLQITLSSLSYMLIHIGGFEFICSQSPHSMKGLLFGLLYTIKGLYQVIATLLALPFTFWAGGLVPSCGFYYYLANIIIGLLALLVYVWVAKRYRYRERDEPSRIHQYAEEYYSKK